MNLDTTGNKTPSVQDIEAAWKQFDNDLCIPGASAPSRGLITMIMGKIGTWKTTTAALWPNPVFMSITKEGGEASLGQFPQIWGMTPPPSYNIRNIDMFNEKMNFLVNNAAKMGFKTIVVDSLTMLVDMWVGELLVMRAAELAYSRKKRITEIEKFQAIMEQSDWGRLENYICRNVADRLHGTGLNVVYTVLLKEKTRTEVDGPRRGEARVTETVPDIQGATARKIPSMCDLLLYAKKEQRIAQGGMKHAMVYYTETPPGDTMIELRHRFGPCFPEGRLVDPEYGDWIPTFRAIQQRIGPYIRL